MFSYSQEDIERFLFYEYNFQNSVDIVKQKYKKVNILKEKKLINQRVSLNLDSHIQNLISRKSSPENYKDELEQTKWKLEKTKEEIEKNKKEIQNLVDTLNQIKSSRFFRLWQGYCKLRDDIIKRHNV